jgi:hypothetical protein
LRGIGEARLGLRQRYSEGGRIGSQDARRQKYEQQGSDKSEDTHGSPLTESSPPGEYRERNAREERKGRTSLLGDVVERIANSFLKVKKTLVIRA